MNENLSSNCFSSQEHHANSYTVNWLNPDTNILEVITVTEENPNKRTMVMRGIRNLNTLKGCTKERAERAAKFMLRSHNIGIDIVK